MGPPWTWSLFETNRGSSLDLVVFETNRGSSLDLFVFEMNRGSSLDLVVFGMNRGSSLDLVVFFEMNRGSSFAKNPMGARGSFHLQAARTVGPPRTCLFF